MLTFNVAKDMVSLAKIVLISIYFKLKHLFQSRKRISMVLVIERENEMSKRKISFVNLSSGRLALICFVLLNPGVY